MQITDQQFIDAMRASVCERGGDHTALATYWSPFGGGASCIVGYALAKIDQRLCPRNNEQMADVLLPSLGVSRRVAIAAYIAQHLNDSAFRWKIVLDGFEHALVNFPDGISNSDAIHLARVRADRQRAMETRSAYKPYAAGGIVTTSIGTLANGGKITVNFAAVENLTAQMNAFAKALNEVQITAPPIVNEESLAAMGIDPPYTKTAHALAV